LNCVNIFRHFYRISTIEDLQQDLISTTWQVTTGSTRQMAQWESLLDVSEAEETDEDLHGLRITRESRDE
jgi:hypothetical protein